MKHITSYLSLVKLENLASRSNLRYGQAIAEDGDVKVLEKDDFHIVAHVQHKQGEKRTVKLESTHKGLKWKCTCTNRKDLFCQHCVATALSVV